MNGVKAGHEDPSKYVYDEIVINDKKYEFRAGKENFIEDMIKSFPDEEEGIRSYVYLVEKVAKNELFFNMKIIKNKYVRKFIEIFHQKYFTDYYYYVNTSAYDIIKTLINNEQLIAVLCGQFGNYGPTPKNASFLFTQI